jgi:mannose-6-phosphate isomerase-like protein (cupin superfamily)
MYVSLSTMLVASLISFANVKQLGSLEKYGYVCYLLSIFAVHKLTLLEHQFIEMPVFYGLLFTSTIIIGVQRILEFYNVEILYRFIYRKYFRVSWCDLVYNRLAETESYKNVITLKKEISEHSIIFTLIVNHPTYRKMHYNTFDEVLMVTHGELELKYKGGVTITLRGGDMLKIERKQVHQFVTKKDCEIKIICIK